MIRSQATTIARSAARASALSGAALSRAAAVSGAAALFGLAVLSGCSKGKGGQFSMPPMPVETVTIERKPVVERFQAVGTIWAGEWITVAAEINGVIADLPFREGEPIARGGLIARLQDDEARAAEARADALVEQWKATHARVKAVFETGASSQQELDDAAAALRVAEADLAVARERLDKTRIVAPFAGILGARRVSPGAFVRAGDPITDLAQIRELRVLFSVPERHLASLRRGAAVQVSTIAFPGEVLEGAIDVLEPVLDPATRSARIVARVPNPEERFRPGMSATVSIPLAERPDAVVVPSEAVFVEGDRAFVYVVGADSTVARSALTLGARLAGDVEVVAGLEAGARVVRAGHQKIFDGSKVAPVAAPDSGAAGTR
jgi:membrane fusion protein (multidrug efflux system)